MSEAQPPQAIEPDASLSEPVASETPPRSSFVQQLRATDPVSLSALGTAIVAGIVGVVQTGFMWVARNDEVEAALRAEQVRACVSYRLAALSANERAQFIAHGGVAPEDEDEFRQMIGDHQTAVSQLAYLLPQDRSDGLAEVELESIRAYEAFHAGDMKALAALSKADSAWANAHIQVLDACDSVIREVRDQ